jgi:hypothetical protein
MRLKEERGRSKLTIVFGGELSEEPTRTSVRNSDPNPPKSRLMIRKSRDIRVTFEVVAVMSAPARRMACPPSALRR